MKYLLPNAPFRHGVNAAPPPLIGEALKSLCPSVVAALAAAMQRQANVANGAREGLRYGGYLVSGIVVGSWRYLSFRACREIPEIYINQGDSSTWVGMTW